MNEATGVVSIQRLHVRPGCEQTLVDFYRARRVFERARHNGGLRSGRLLAPAQQKAPFLVITEWDDAEAYERWLESPIRAELAEGLGALLDSKAGEGDVHTQLDVRIAVSPIGRARQPRREHTAGTDISDAAQAATSASDGVGCTNWVGVPE